MSHFSLLVVMDEVPTQEALALKLQKFHEFECTGTNDEHVVDVDETEEARAKYAKDTATRLREVLTADGVMPGTELLNPYDDRFYRDPTEDEEKKIGRFGGSGFSEGLSYTSKDWGDGRGYRSRVRFVPPGFEEVTLPVSRIQSFREWCADYYGLEDKIIGPGEEPDVAGDEARHKYGYLMVDAAGEVVCLIDRTNADKWTWVDADGKEVCRTVGEALPDAPGITTDNLRRVQVGGKKWDWWQVGGRFRGRMLVKQRDRLLVAGADGEVSAMPIPGKTAVLGPAGTFDNDPQRPDGVDICQVGNLDLARMRDLAAADAAKNYDAVHAVIAGRRFDTWEKCRASFGEDHVGARDAYWAQQVVKDLRAAKLLPFDGIGEYEVPREQFLARARDGVLATHAVLKGGAWHERGRGGWWGVVHDEKGEDAWAAEVAKLLDGLPPTTWLAVVDYHI